MVEEIPTDKFRAILEQLDGDLRLLNIYAITKLYLDGKQTEATVRLFRYPNGAAQSEGQPVNWAALKEMLRGKPEVFFQCTTVDQEFVTTSTKALMDKIYPLIVANSTIEVVTATEIADVVHRYFDEKGTHPHRPMNEPNYYYYASDDAIDRLKSETVALPEGFEFFNLEAEHAEEAAKVMPHADEGEADIIRLQLATLPGVGVRCVGTGELAAFEYTNGFGFITNLYTVPKFRHRGLGTAVERRVSQRIGQEVGLRPAKNVHFNRPRVVRMTEANGLWTTLVDEENGEKHVMRWNFFCKEPRSPVIVREN